MRRYNVFSLYVVEKDNHKFICAKIFRNEYKEILTKEKILLEKNDKITPLANHYGILEVVNYKVGKIYAPLTLDKKDILLKYLEINAPIIDKNSDVLIEKQEELEGSKTLERDCTKLTKEESLGNTGILDKNGDVMPPYQKVFAQITDGPKELSKK